MQDQPIQGLGAQGKGTQGLSSTGLGQNSPAAPQSGEGAAAFRALLEGLENQARGLAQTSETLTDSAGLVDAVGQSQRALEQARQVTDQLLEAFRANQQRPSS